MLGGYASRWMHVESVMLSESVFQSSGVWCDVADALNFMWNASFVEKYWPPEIYDHRKPSWVMGSSSSFLGDSDLVKEGGIGIKNSFWHCETVDILFKFFACLSSVKYSYSSSYIRVIVWWCREDVLDTQETALLEGAMGLLNAQRKQDWSDVLLFTCCVFLEKLLTRILKSYFNYSVKVIILTTY